MGKKGLTGRTGMAGREGRGRGSRAGSGWFGCSSMLGPGSAQAVCCLSFLYFFPSAFFF
jgi:hypothetical protein